MQDVVELFGQNFAVSMETVFSTLEHTIRMLRTTGEYGDFHKDDLTDKRERLKQAIAILLEDSLTNSFRTRALPLSPPHRTSTSAIA